MAINAIQVMSIVPRWQNAIGLVSLLIRLLRDIGLCPSKSFLRQSQDERQAVNFDCAWPLGYAQDGLVEVHAAFRQVQYERKLKSSKDRIYRETRFRMLYSSKRIFFKNNCSLPASTPHTTRTAGCLIQPRHVVVFMFHVTDKVGL